MLVRQLFKKVHEYISGQLGLADLEEWLVPRLPIFYKLPFGTVSELVDKIEFGLAEISAGVRSEPEFRRLLTEFITTWAMPISYPETGATQSQCSDKIQKEVFVPSEFAMSWVVR